MDNFQSAPSPDTGDEKQQARQMAQLDWIGLLRELHLDLGKVPPASPLHLDWMVRDWIQERFPNVAIRTAEGEVLAGNPPPRLRFILNSWDTGRAGGGLGLCVLLGEETIQSENVLAATWGALDREQVVAARGRGAFEAERRLQAEAGVEYVAADSSSPDLDALLARDPAEIAATIVDVARGVRKVPARIPPGLSIERYLPCLHILEQAGGELPEFAATRPVRSKSARLRWSQ